MNIWKFDSNGQIIYRPYIVHRIYKKKYYNKTGNTHQFVVIRGFIEGVSIRCHVELSAVVEGHVEYNVIFTNKICYRSDLWFWKCSRSGVGIRARIRTGSNFCKMGVPIPVGISPHTVGKSNIWGPGFPPQSVLLKIRPDTCVVLIEIISV